MWLGLGRGLGLGLGMARLDKAWLGLALAVWMAGWLAVWLAGWSLMALADGSPYSLCVVGGGVGGSGGWRSSPTRLWYWERSTS